MEGRARSRLSCGGRRHAATLAALAVGLAALLSSAASADEAPRPLADRLVLDTDEHELTLYAGDEVLARYAVGLGSRPPGKLKRGDQRTPKGTYRLMKGRASKRFHRFLPVSYPNADDAERGLESGLITPKQHRAILAATRAGEMPPQNTPLGGHIGIHGYGNELSWIPKSMQVFHRVIDATEGCIIVSDDEVEAIERSYRPGAVLVIE